ncbi:hypothetical protein BDN72DRAFT_841918 [Pluteus cervinus]|uniref:Uncharacterized protein n=1 Tax=Pluteus cervinus TaxID=181527 RepID=A0ACD3ASV9_9AGAR|nr:hypothetical protein BDN72DRAFT_841918 [Pluteus cervinus]
MHGDGGNGGGGGGDGGDGGGSPQQDIRLLPVEVMARNHALLCSIGFLILLPLGVLVARYVRTFTNKWFYSHATIQLVLAGPLIVAGYALGHQTTTMLEQPQFADPHQKVGLILFVLYLFQVLLGAFIHFVKFPKLLGGRRPPQNYVHAILGLVILALADYQVHYGLFTEWALRTGGLHMVPESAKHAWMALLIVFWVFYFGGLVLLRRQFKIEQEMREKAQMDERILLGDKGSN